MSREPSRSESTSLDTTSDRERIRSALPWLWLALTATWLAIIFVTDQQAWPLPLSIAITLGLWSRFRGTRELAPDKG